MANQVKTPIQNYFEKELYGNLTLEIHPLWLLELSAEGYKNLNKPLLCELREQNS
jgi:hypothetical protein